MNIVFFKITDSVEAVDRITDETIENILEMNKF